ncbi:MAG: hypothetical protein KH135_05180 [Firmicutes bacterium]|nr:hypothetical protein [Bacillota bacterium]
MNCNDYERIKEKIERDSKCKSQYAYFLGATGPTGPTGPAGGDSSTCCDCVDQMRNIVEQIFTLYPDSNLFITLDGGDAIIGRPGEIINSPGGKPTIFEIVTSNPSISTICIHM